VSFEQETDIFEQDVTGEVCISIRIIEQFLTGSFRHDD